MIIKNWLRSGKESMMEGSGKYFDTDFTDDNRLKFLSDGKLRTEDGQIFHIHKFTLAKNSKYFYALFCGMGKDKKDILIPGIKGEVLSSILSYIYTGNICMTKENLSDLMIASDYLMLDDLLSQMQMRLRNNLTIVNSLSVFMAAVKINRRDILLESYRFVQTHFESLVNSNNTEFGELPLETLKQFLSDRNLCVRSERTIYLSIVQWIEADSPNRLHWMPDLLMYLMILDVDEDLATEILEHDAITKNPCCNDIMDIKLRFPNASDLKVILIYFQLFTKPTMPLYIHRLPEKLNCIAHYFSYKGLVVIEIYLTYDEKMDLWRKVLKTDFTPKFLIGIEDCIYMLRTSENGKFYYNIAEKQWHEMSDFTIARNYYVVVKLEDCIYVLGGISPLTGGEVYDVEFYDSDFDVWYSTMPMIPITSFTAISLNSSIYVVGYKLTFDQYEMVAQVYDAPSDTWSLLPPVMSTRSHFALVAYLEKVYVIGGISEGEHLTTVEIYDPVKNEWTRESDLPHFYYFPKAIVFHGLLVVYDNHVEDRKYLKTKPPVFWNLHQRCWERFEESSPINDLHLYQFFTIEDYESISIISKENRHPDMVFEKSPFS